MSKKTEKGQAFMEFVVCLIPLILVFSGLILVAVLGRANVQNTINARSSVDLGKSPGKAKALEIISWNYGKDLVPFTNDDSPVTGAKTYFTGEDFDTEKYTVSDTFEGKLNLQELHDKEYIYQMPGRVNFTLAADLVGAEVSVDDVLSMKKMQFFSRMFQIYLNSFHMNIKDTSFMPRGKDTHYEVTVD